MAHSVMEEQPRGGGIEGGSGTRRRPMGAGLPSSPRLRRDMMPRLKMRKAEKARRLEVEDPASRSELRRGTHWL